MSSEEITKYFDATESREIREDLVFSANMVSEPKFKLSREPCVQPLTWLEFRNQVFFLAGY
mgnify:CR=1 FL=1